MSSVKMWNGFLFLLLGCLVQTQALAVWQCTTDDECSSLSGSVCTAGECVCPATQQIVGAGTMCADFAPYLTSSCVDDFQCSRLFTNFQCRRNDDETGNCFCQPGHHYFLGRCWPSIPLGEACSRHEECMGPIRDPYAMSCNQTCQCAEGYYSRQRGECRRIAAAVGDRCVLDEDCQFENGVCDLLAFTCHVSTNPTVHTQSLDLAANVSHKMAAMAFQDGVACGATSPCSAPFQCSSVGICVCPLGYYGSPDGTACYAELGSPSTEEQCVGLLAEVQNGVCTCPANFFFDEGMRDCTKVARRITDFCLTDAQCHSFGVASYCGPPGEWGLRNCECDLEESVWDAQRSMCRLFAGIGEACQVDSDCMAGELEIQCQVDDEGEGFCACPDGLMAVDGLCLTSGLEVGDECQMTQECTGTADTECIDGRCTCGNGYQQVDDYCAPSLGGTCIADADCIINNTVCVGGSGLTCQCRESYVEYDDECWENSLGYNGTCLVDAQCVDALGPSGACQGGACLCGANFHYRDEACWPMTGLFETCSRSSQCFLGELTDTVVCRNSICQCDFNHPYSEELGICISSAVSVSSSIFLVISALIYMFSNA